MKPYVYIIQNLERTHWYVGMRSANECPANEDTGYWGSSKYLKELIKNTGKENWTKTIISEFDTKHDANEFEQLMIEFMWEWPGRVNKGRNGFVDHSDPEVKAKHKSATTIANQKKAQDPVYRANQKAGATIANQKKAQDPVWQANQKAASAIANKKKAKPFIATLIATGEEFYCESGTCDQARALDLNQGNVSKCLNGNRPQHKGFTFRYV